MPYMCNNRATIQISKWSKDLKAQYIMYIISHAFLISNIRRVVNVVLRIISFGWFPGVWILCAGVSEHSVCSIFIGRVNKKNNWDKIVRVYVRTYVCMYVCTHNLMFGICWYFVWSVCTHVCICIYIYIYIYIFIYTQGVTGGTDQTSGGCSLC